MKKKEKKTATVDLLCVCWLAPGAPCVWKRSEIIPKKKVNEMKTIKRMAVKRRKTNQDRLGCCCMFAGWLAGFTGFSGRVVLLACFAGLLAWLAGFACFRISFLGRKVSKTKKDSVSKEMTKQKKNGEREKRKKKSSSDKYGGWGIMQERREFSHQPPYTSLFAVISGKDRQIFPPTVRHTSWLQTETIKVGAIRTEFAKGAGPNHIHIRIRVRNQIRIWIWIWIWIY